MRDPFYSCIIACAAYVPRLVVGCLQLIPQYGYFKDYFRLLSEAPSVTMIPDVLQEVHDTIINIVVQQLRADESLLRAGHTAGTQSPCSVVAAATDDSASKAASHAISLCAKYCPREGKGFARENKDQFGTFIRRLFPDDPAAKQKYRQLLSRLCAALDVAEQKICSQRHAELNVESLPRACYRTCEPILLSRGLLPSHRSTAEPTTATLPLTLQRVVQRLLEVKQRQQAARRRFHQRQQHQRWRGNRSAGRGRAQEATRSHDADEVQLPSLVALREKYEARKQKAVPRGVQRSAVHVYSEAALVSQWQRLVRQQEATTTPPTRASAATGAALAMGNVVGIVDTSASMSGGPLELALALSLVASHLQPSPGLRRRLLTFDTCPQWLSLRAAPGPTEALTLPQQLDAVLNAPASYFCHLPRVLSLIARVAARERWTAAQLPTVVVFTDRPCRVATDVFGDSCSPWGVEDVQRLFAAAGEKHGGEPLPLPRIVCWNLRAEDASGEAAAEGSVHTVALTPTVSLEVFTGRSVEVLHRYVSMDAAAATAAAVAPPKRPPPTSATAATVAAAPSAPSQSTSGSSAMSHHHRSPHKEESFSWAALASNPRYDDVRAAVRGLFAVDGFAAAAELRRSAAAARDFCRIANEW